MVYSDYMEKVIGIYAIKNTITGRSYVGQSMNTYVRLSQHKSDLKNNRHRNKYLQQDVNVYGLENFEFVILERIYGDNCSRELLDFLEKKHISILKSNCRMTGYNIESGGMLTKNMAEETKQIISLSKIGRTHIVSEETKQKMRENHSHYWLGKKHSEETKKLLSKMRKGKPSHLKGKNISNAHKDKIAKSQTGARWMNKDGVSHFVHIDKIEQYLSNGYVFGRTPFKKHK